MLVDMGGGAYLRFGQSQAKLSDLALVVISHLHPDHVSDLPAFLWLSHQVRKEPLPLSVPPPARAWRVRPASMWRRIFRHSSRVCSTRRMVRFR
jgi:ribonuclease BN (tRNA processing enzyme)